MTFTERLEQWRASRALNALPTTQLFHREICKIILDRWLDPCQPCESITLAQVLAFAEHVAHYCPSRWNAVVGVLRVITPHGKELRRRKIKLTRPAPPTQAEFSRLLSECDRLAISRAGLVCEFLGNTGLRISGARGVRWSDVGPDMIQYTAKGGRLCFVPILSGLRPVLERLRALDDGSGFVIPRESVKRGLAKACQRAGLRHLTHHDFRHMFITRCIEAGVDSPTVARWVGHGDGGALLSKRYFHLMDAHSRAMALRVRV